MMVLSVEDKFSLSSDLNRAGIRSPERSHEPLEGSGKHAACIRCRLL